MRQGREAREHGPAAQTDRAPESERRADDRDETRVAEPDEARVEANGVGREKAAVGQPGQGVARAPDPGEGDVLGRGEPQARHEPERRQRHAETHDHRGLHEAPPELAGSLRDRKSAERDPEHVRREQVNEQRRREHRHRRASSDDSARADVPLRAPVEEQRREQ